KLRRLKKVGTSQRIESSEDEENMFNQGRISDDIDEGIELVDDQEKDAQVKGRQADTQAEIYNIDLDHTSKVLTMQEDTEVQEVVKFVNATKLMTEVATTAASIPIPAIEPAVVAISAAKPAAQPKRFNFSRYILDCLVHNVDSSSKFYMYPRFIQMIIQAQVVDLSSRTTRYISLALTQK
nr:hypothetical protein [Tanacetum cinerariifolium]